MIKFQLSDYARRSLIPSAVNEMTDEFARDFREGIDINLGVGYVNDNTIPSVAITEALTTALSKPEKYRNTLNYGSAEGSRNLLRSIKEFYTRNKIGGLTDKDFDDKSIIIGANGATSILESIAHLLKPGIVITSEPCYYIYTEFLERLGFTVIGIPEEDDGIDIEKLRETVLSLPPDQLRFFYIVTVNNPTCTVISNKKRRQLLEIVKEYARDNGQVAPLILDRAYEDIIHDVSVEKPESMHKYDKTGVVFEIGTLSKILAPALRIGYLIAKKSSFTQTLTQRISDIGFSAPLMNQDISSILLDKMADLHLDSVRKGYAVKAEFLLKLIDKKLSDYIQLTKGGKAGFYIYIQFKDIHTYKGSAFFNYLSRKTGNEEIDCKGGVLNPRLIYIPGNICTVKSSSISEAASKAMRLSFGFEDTNILETAVSLIEEACDYASRMR